MIQFNCQDWLIEDTFDLNEAAKQIDLMRMMVCKVSLDVAGKIVRERDRDSSDGMPAKLEVLYDNSKFHSELETVKLSDKQFKAVWKNVMTRILFRTNVLIIWDSWQMKIAP